MDELIEQTKLALEGKKVKSRLETIKAGTNAETKVRGYQYAFKLKAPEPLVRIGLLAGFGEKNSLGFGCGEVVTNGNC